MFLRLLLLVALSSAYVTPIKVYAQASPTPTGAPTPTLALPFKYGDNKLIFVFATGGDAATRQKFVSVLTQKVQLVQSYYDKVDGKPFSTRFVPEPDWTVADYITACQTVYDPGIANYKGASGALIVAITQISTFTESHFINRTNKSVIDATLFYSGCDASFHSKREGSKRHHYFVVTSKQAVRTYVDNGYTKKVTVTMATATPGPGPTATPPPYFVSWQTNVSSEGGHYTFWTPLPVLGALLSVISGYTALAASHTASSSTTTTFPTPDPFFPPPRNGYVSSVTQMNGTGINQSNLTAVATGFFGSALNYDQNLTSIQTGDNQSLHAVSRLVNDFVFGYKRGMYCPKPPATASAEGGTTETFPTAMDGSMCFHILNADQDF